MSRKQRKRKETRDQRRNIKCIRCGKSIFRTYEGRKLRELGFCQRCLPDVYRCQATTIKGDRCKGVIVSAEKYCKIHLGHPIKIEIDYYEYIKSDAWKEKARKAKTLVGWRCQLCNKAGTDYTLHAHHRTYERLGHELDQDITVLCTDCHHKFHGTLNEK